MTPHLQFLAHLLIFLFLKATKEQITIKECRFKGDMKEKMLERWNVEVSIINRLRHDNVIAGIYIKDDLVSLLVFLYGALPS